VPILNSFSYANGFRYLPDGSVSWMLLGGKRSNKVGTPNPPFPLFGEGGTINESPQSAGHIWVLADMKGTDFDAVFFVGGFGTMWDFPDNADVQRVIREVFETKGVVSAVCHGPVALANVKLSDGSYLVAGKEVAGFSNEEEDAVQRRSIVPYTVGDILKERGAKYTQGGVFHAHVVVDGNLITGQNPPSAKKTAEAVVAALAKCEE